MVVLKVVELNHQKKEKRDVFVMFQPDLLPEDVVSIGKVAEDATAAAARIRWGGLGKQMEVS